jgi:hypothetical protein
VLASARAENAAATSALAATAADAGTRLQAALQGSDSPGDLRQQVGPHRICWRVWHLNSQLGLLGGSCNCSWSTCHCILGWDGS